MIKIRLQRHGARHAPFYRMVVAPSTARRDGKFIEVLGTYNPQAHVRTEELNLKMDRIDHWLGVGAQPTDTAKSLIRQGRLSPEEWLERSERQASKRLARSKKEESVASIEKVNEESTEAKEEAKEEIAEESDKKEAKSEEVNEAVKEAKAEEPTESKEEAKEEIAEESDKKGAKSEETPESKEETKEKKISAKQSAKKTTSKAKPKKTESDTEES